jgi:ArsR family transcriptional regulator
VAKLLRSLQDVAQEHLAEVREIVRDYYEHPDTLEAVDAETLHTRLQTQSVVLLDVRPLDEFSAGHIPGAVSVPIEELDRRLEQLPRDREIVAYCRGPYCLFSKQAVQRLRGHGFRAFQMRDGVAEWEELGYPVAAAADLPRTLNARQDKEEGETE